MCTTLVLLAVVPSLAFIAWGCAFFILRIKAAQRAENRRAQVVWIILFNLGWIACVTLAVLLVAFVYPAVP